MVNDNWFFLWMEMDNRGQRATLSVSIILGAFNWPSPFSKKASGRLKGDFLNGIENREGYTVYSVLLFGRIYDQSDL